MKRMIAMMLVAFLMFTLMPVQASASDVMSTEEFLEALQNAKDNDTDLVLTQSVEITEDLDIQLDAPRKLIITNGSEFIIKGEGVMVSFDCLFWVRHGHLRLFTGSDLDIKPTALLIVGADGLVLEGIRYETSGGSKFSACGTVWCGGRIMVVPDGLMRIDNGATTYIDGTLRPVGQVHVASGTLHIRNNMENLGYLKVFDMGKLVTDPGSRFTVEKDPSCHGRLVNQGEAEFNGLVEIQGTCINESTMDFNGTVNTASTGSIIVPGTLNINGTLNCDGTLSVKESGIVNVNNGATAYFNNSVENYGAIQIVSGGVVENNADWSGNDPVTVVPNSVPMYRMYDPNSGEHFYTGSTVERDFLVSAGWHYEGVGFNFPFEGRPVYRLYEPVHGEHLYTMNEAEKAKLISWGWNDEGVAFNSAGEDEVPQYRLHNPNAKRGGYHFTGSEEERDFLISIGWINEGIGWYSCIK